MFAAHLFASFAVDAVEISYVAAAVHSRREFVDRSVVVIAAMNCGTVKVSKPINNHAIIRKRAIWRALEGMNDSLGPLTAANGT